MKFSWVSALFLHCSPSLAHYIASLQVVQVLPPSYVLMALSNDPVRNDSTLDSVCNLNHTRNCCRRRREQPWIQLQQ
ncbi:hypothetical protein EDD18DRAFT_1206670 [Armillaria luteobubalina]|uniref:Hydrophobin n=1 Tax=Armillaria luteobubalina TaxID=153913 RepID=A0AA39UB13_9AGAR|nr:hypothetical protein EDD18DRAFT_1206670 [Armillaria luteobubalina]